MSGVDLLISGAGPAGLCLARALSGHGLRIVVAEPQAREALAKPAFDGREIALTQHSARLMRDLGLWERIEALDPHALSPLRNARVLNGPSPFAMVISHALSTHDELGWLVSNHLIREAAWQAVQDAIERHGDIELVTGDAVDQVRLRPDAAQATLRSGRCLDARLMVAADSRFSNTRRAVGIAADLHDFGRTMLVCAMTHDAPHEHAAWEWFDYGQTLALLPMNDDPRSGRHRASIVLTLPSHEIEPIAAMESDAFNAEIERRFAHRLGRMALASTRHTYPLVAVYPRRMVATRFACVGDAAVGMHPVTAHGFNFGLLGIDTLARSVLKAQASGSDIGAWALLEAYERRHRQATRPLFLATQLITRLYTAEATPIRAVRDLALQVADRITPFKRAIAASLTGSH